LATLPPSVSPMSENLEASTSRNPEGLHGLYRDNFTFFNRLVDDSFLADSVLARLVSRPEFMREFFVSLSLLFIFLSFSLLYLLFLPCLLFSSSYFPSYIYSPFAFPFIPLPFIVYFFSFAFLPRLSSSVLLVYEQTRRWHKQFFLY
jgi:hypothetical protein